MNLMQNSGEHSVKQEVYSQASVKQVSTFVDCICEKVHKQVDIPQIDSREAMLA